MTNAQKWVAAFLGLFLVLFLLERITKKEESSIIPPSMSGQNSRQSAKVTSGVDGPTLMKQIGCISCHGDDLKWNTNGSAHFRKLKITGRVMNLLIIYAILHPTMEEKDLMSIVLNIKM